MTEEDRQRRIKKTDGAKHRTGTLRAAVKPGVRAISDPIQALIEAFMASSGKSMSQTGNSSALASKKETLQAAFELSSNDEPYLFSNLSSSAQTIAGILLSSSGFHLLDGQKGFANISWEEFAACDLSFQNNMVVIGKIGISSPDSKLLYSLFQQIQAQLKQ